MVRSPAVQVLLRVALYFGNLFTETELNQWCWFMLSLEGFLKPHSFIYLQLFLAAQKIYRSAVIFKFCNCNNKCSIIPKQPGRSVSDCLQFGAQQVADTRFIRAFNGLLLLQTWMMSAVEANQSDELKDAKMHRKAQIDAFLWVCQVKGHLLHYSVDTNR